MEEIFRAYLAENTGLAALIGERIQWAVREAPPSLALHLIDAPADQTLKGESGLVQARVQMDAWGLTFLEAKAIGDAAFAALPPVGAVVAGIKFLACRRIDRERQRLGESPNIFHRTRTDIRVSYRPA